MAKKIKEVKTISGHDVEWFQGNDSWLSCRTEDGEKFSIGYKAIFELLGKFNFHLEKFGNNWRVNDFSFAEDDEELSPLKLIEKLS